MYITGRVTHQRWDNTGDATAEVVTEMGTFPVRVRNKSQAYAKHVQAIGWDGLRWKKDVDVMIRISAVVAVRKR